MPRVKAAVLERSRRATAGKRMSSLVGKAQEDDDAFWSHSIWSEAGGGFSDGGSRKRRRGEDGSSSSSSEEEGSDDGSSVSDGEGSYRASDEDSAAAVDQFDSDFDESESDDDDGEEDAEGEEERELRAEERRAKASKRKKNRRLGVPMKASAGRELMKKRTGKMSKRGPMGEGWNLGLVLNWPPPSGGGAPAARTGPAVPGTVPAQVVAQASASIPAAPQIQTQHIPSKPAPTIAKPKGGNAVAPPAQRALRAGPTSAPPPPSPKRGKAKHAKQKQTAQGEKKKSQRHQITQEEMILESIKSTETDNAKWLNARKRSKEEAAQLEKAATAGHARKSLHQKPVSRFHSRRGCNNTLTFMDMDQLPEILTRKSATPRSGSFGDSASIVSPRRRRLDSAASERSATASPEAEKKHDRCVITGKIARYRDPKTMLGYHDIDAYKELKRRLESGEIEVPKPKPKPKPKSSSNKRKKQSEKSNGVSERSGTGSMHMGQTKTTHIPFTAGQPTMIAEMTSPTVNLKVMVTQGGCPVSPPRRIHLKLPEKSDAKGLQPAPLVATNSNATNHTVDLKEGAPNQQQSSEAKASLDIEVKKTAPSTAPEGIVKVTHDNSSSRAAVRKDESSSELQSSCFPESAESAEAKETVQTLGAPPNGQAGNGNRGVGGAKPPTAVRGVAPTACLAAAQGAKKGPEKKATAPCVKDISARTDGNGKTATGVATPKEKRTTIEAN